MNSVKSVVASFLSQWADRIDLLYTGSIVFWSGILVALKISYSGY